MFFRFGKKEVKERTVQEEVAFLFGERERLHIEMKEAAKARREQKEKDSAMVAEFEVVVKKLNNLGIKNSRY